MPFERPGGDGGVIRRLRRRGEQCKRPEGLRASEAFQKLQQRRAIDGVAADHCVPCRLHFSDLKLSAGRLI